ncbi:MAG: hypothetical protein M1294_15980 [Firmicutes bacterium]|nr:hypothetical protein [Bacillota bacterium]
MAISLVSNPALVGDHWLQTPGKPSQSVHGDVHYGQAINRPIDTLVAPL